MRHTYIVTYDICDPKRLRKVYKAMLGWGEHLQLSVFQCELNHRELVELRVALDRLIQHNEDQVLLVDVGVAQGGAEGSISALGRPYIDPERIAIVV
ncbi:MAG TPA: CRISPR-associated endonuclease Cas2 [Polyangiaceae bacterium]|jgi:CRISPR-associated protein Cas2|nr:CRISPR-associated endonuclease Cas2 [Polyangiaceae bacterium]